MVINDSKLLQVQKKSSRITADTIREAQDVEDLRWKGIASAMRMKDISERQGERKSSVKDYTVTIANNDFTDSWIQIYLTKKN